MKHHPISLAFDMRAPDLGTPVPELYAAAIEMARWADETGLSGLLLMDTMARKTATCRSRSCWPPRWQPSQGASISCSAQ